MKEQNVYLRPLTLSDTDLIVKWRNTDNVRKNLFSQELITSESHAQYYEEYINSHKCYQFIVEQIVNEDGNTYGCSIPVGTVYLKNIEWNNRKALMGIFIGNAMDRGKGLGREAVQLILQYGFMQLGLNKIYLQIICNEDYRANLYEEWGLRKEAHLRADYCRDGVFYDVEQWSVLKEEFLPKSIVNL